MGLWPAENEGAKYWLGILTELKNRGVGDILIAAVDGLTGFGDAIRTVFPQTEGQLYLVHVVRSALRLVPYKDRRMMAADLKKIYTAQRPVLELSGRNPIREIAAPDPPVSVSLHSFSLLIMATSSILHTGSAV